MNLERLMLFADNLSSLADCHRAKVGCILVDESGEPMASGFNSGFCKGNECPALDGALSCGTKHAELAALDNLPKDQKAYAAIVTKKPCAKCNEALNNAGIKFIIYRGDHNVF